MRFSIGPGEGVALIGPSGSGKTTVLRLIAGVLSPDAGQLDVTGRVGSLLSTEAGLLGLLTGRENASLLGVLAGMTRAEAEASLEEVKATTHLEDAFERPVLSYSEGMKARLGFAVADQTEPDILVLDEVHEALDHEFRQIVAERAHRVLETGGIVVAAGHDHPLLETFCDRALWLADGRIELEGPFDEVRSAYLSAAPAAT
jgi:ABC-type polysaccharide/polyol phosphate transport system ATPase subunit